MALTEAQKKYQNSEKGKAARARYFAKKKAQVVINSEPEVKVEIQPEETQTEVTE